MESTFVFDSQITSCLLLPSEMPMASTFEKKCLLCNMKEIDGKNLVDSQESSLLLCKVLNVPHLMNDLKKLENINYCHPCTERILKIHESLEILKKLEKEVLEEKYLIKLQLETNYKVVRNVLYYSQANFGVELVNEMRFKSIKSMLEKVVKNQIDRKVCSNRKNYRIMKNITITEKLKIGTFEEHILKETTPLIYNTISEIEEKPFINNSHFVDSATNSSFNHAELPLTSHSYDFDEIKLEFFSRETNNTADIKDPFEGIATESGFLTKNPTPQKTFICGTCETNFDDYSQLDQHCCTHIGLKSFKFCPNQVISKVSLSTNSCIDVINLHKCRYCVKVFPNQFGLIRHERIHTGEKPFICGYCDKTCRDLSDLKRHENIHKEEKPFKCKFCEKGFSQKPDMARHERFHTIGKPFKCGYCDKTFRDFSQLKRHENIHKQEKPFKCQFCEKRFSQKAGVDRHESIHRGEKAFECKFCGKSFSRKASMEIHKRNHRNEKPFTCGYFDETF